MMPNRMLVSVMTMTKLQPLCVRARGEGAADPLNRGKPFIWQSTNFSGSMQAATKNLKKMDDLCSIQNFFGPER